MFCHQSVAIIDHLPLPLMWRYQLLIHLLLGVHTKTDMNVPPSGFPHIISGETGIHEPEQQREERKRHGHSPEDPEPIREYPVHRGSIRACPRRGAADLVCHF